MNDKRSAYPDWLQTAVRWGYAPLMLIGFNGLALSVIFANTTPLERAVALFVLAAAGIYTSFAVERILPYQIDWNRSHGDTGRDILHFIVNESLSLGPTVLVPLFVLVAPEPASSNWPTNWPLILQVVLAFAIFDLGQNLVHWASHVSPFLWRFHEVHHEVQRMYGVNGVLKHPIYQIASGIVGTLPLVLLGIPKLFGVAIAFCSLIQLLLQHSNADYKSGPIRYVISTAEVHRFHHLRGKKGNVNFALFFSFWDHLFGNAYYENRRLTTEEIGLEDREYPKSWLGQMLAPFKSRK